MDAADLAARGWTRETRIRRDANGRWYDGDEPIDHRNITRAFDRWIERAPDGRLCLRNDIHWVYVEVDGPPVFVRVATIVDGRVQLELSDGRVEWLEPNTLRQGPDDALYCDVREGSLAARFDRSAQMVFADVLDEDEQGVFVRLDGASLRPPRVSDGLAPLHPRAGPRDAP